MFKNELWLASFFSLPSRDDAWCLSVGGGGGEAVRRRRRLRCFLWILTCVGLDASVSSTNGSLSTTGEGGLIHSYGFSSSLTLLAEKLDEAEGRNSRLVPVNEPECLASQIASLVLSRPSGASASSQVPWVRTTLSRSRLLSDPACLVIKLLTASADTWVLRAATLLNLGKCSASGGGVNGRGDMGDVISANNLFPIGELRPFGVEGLDAGGMAVTGQGPLAPYQWNVNFSTELLNDLR